MGSCIKVEEIIIGKIELFIFVLKSIIKISNLNLQRSQLQIDCVLK